MGYYDDYGNYIEDEYDYDETGGMAGQYYSPEQIAQMEAMLGQGTPQFDLAGLDPTMGAMFGGIATPQMDTKGRIQPRDLGVQTQLTNFGQDIASSGVSNLPLAYMGGPGSYAPGALDPVWDETPIQLSAIPQMQMYAQSGGLQGTLADLIMGGMNPSQAAARVRAMMANPDKFADIVSPDEIESMRGELELTQPAFMGAKAEPDLNSINRIAEGIAKPYMQEMAMLQAPDVQYDPATGRAVRREQRPSPQMEYLAKMGLPDPRAKYDVEYALKSDPTLSSMLNSVASTQSERDTMRKEFEDRIKRTKKYREDDLKNQDADRRETEKYQSATKQALNDYFSEMSQYGSERNARAATAPAPPAPPTEAEAYAERNREGPPGWLKALPGNALDAVKGMPDYFKDLGGAAVSPPDLGVPNRAPLGTNLGFREGPDVINGITKPEMNLPRRPITADMKMGLDPEGYSMMDQILGKPVRDVVGYNKRRAADEAIDPATRAQMYMAQQRGVDKRSSSAALRYLLGLAPTVVAGRQGRTPATDAIQQRLSPLYQMGALGQ